MNKKYRKYILKRMLVTLLFVGCFFLQVIPVKAQQMHRLIQTTTDEELWNSYVNLGMTKTYISEEDTLEEVQEKVKQSCVYIHLYENNGSVSDKAHGSGFIINITKDKMYIATCRHVCYLGWGPKNGYCILFNEDELNDIWKENNLKGTLLGTSGDFEFGDFGIIEVDISNLSYEDKICFKKAPINKDSINIKPGTEGFFYHISKNGNYSLNKVEILPTNQTLCFSWAIERLYTQCTYVSVNGDSGSYYFDKNGNIIGILVGMTGKVIDGTRVRRDHILRPGAIFDAYEKIVGSDWE